MHVSALVAGPWSYFLPAVRTVNSSMESLPPPQGPAESSPHLLLSPSPRTHPQTAGASSPSTSPSLLGAKLLTWLPSAAPQMAMQACTHPCPHSARPLWTSTNCMCRAPLQAKSLMRGRTRKTRQRIPLCPSKVSQQRQILSKLFWLNAEMSLMICTFLLWDTDLSVREESDNDPNQSDDGDPEASPTKSPTTPKNVKCKNSSGTCTILDMCSDIRSCHVRAFELHTDTSASSSLSPLQGFVRTYYQTT